MKLKRILVFLLPLFFPSLLNGQQVFSLSGGVTIPKRIYTSTNPHLSVASDFKNTFAVSFDYNKYTGKHFGFSLQLNYINTVADLIITSGSQGGGYHTDSVYYKLGFLNINVLPGFKWGEKVQFFLQAGPYFGILAHTNNDARGNIQSPDIGLTGVLGLRIHIARNVGFLIKNVYSYGFVNIYRDAGNLSNVNIMILGGMYYSLPEN